MARAEVPGYDPNAVQYKPGRVTVPDCGGLSFAPSSDWSVSRRKAADGALVHQFDADAALFARIEAGLGKIFVDNLILVSVMCKPHAPFEGAAPDAKRIAKRQKTFVQTMVDSHLGAKSISASTRPQAISVPGAVAALVYFQEAGGKKPRSEAYFDIRTPTHEVTVLVNMPKAGKPKTILPAGTVITDTLSTGEVVSGKLTSDGAITAGGTYVSTRSFKDDMGFMLQLFKSFRG